MKFIHFFFTVIFFVKLLSSCSGKVNVEKPDNLIGQEKMEAILYDAIIMDAMSTFSNKNPTFETLIGKSYLYAKYKIDSLQLVDSENYYAKKPREYLKIHTDVMKRIVSTKDSLDRLDKIKK